MAAQWTNIKNNSFLISGNLQIKKDSLENLILMPTSGTERYQYNQLKKKWILIDQETFPKEIKKRVHTVLQKMISSSMYGIPNKSYGNRIEDRGSQITLSALGQDAPIEKKKLWDPDQKKRQIMKKDFEAKVPNVSVSVGGMTSLDILPKGFNKALGLKRLLKSLGYKVKEMLYVGDALFPGGNDYAAVEARFDTLEVNGPKDTIAHIKKWIKNAGQL